MPAAVTEHLQVICNSLGNSGQYERSGVTDSLWQWDPLPAMHLVLDDVVIYGVGWTNGSLPRQQETTVRQLRHCNV